MSARRWLAILIAGAGASIASLSTASVPLVGAPVASVSVPAADLSASPDGVVSVLSPRGGIRFLVMTKTYPPAPLLDPPSASAAVETSHPMPASARMDLQLAADAYRRGAAAYRHAVGDLVRQRYDARVALRVEAPDVDGASTDAAPAPLPDYEALESAERLFDASKALERAITKSPGAPDVPKLRSHLADLDDRMALGAESIADRERYSWPKSRRSTSWRYRLRRRGPKPRRALPISRGSMKSSATVPEPS